MFKALFIYFLKAAIPASDLETQHPESQPIARATKREVAAMMNHREKPVLDSAMRKLPSTWKSYQVRLYVPDNGIPIIEYNQLGGFVKSSKKPVKSIQFVDLLFADKKHDTSEKWAFSIYTIDKTLTFLPADEIIMNEWLTKIRELHSNLYPEFKRYDAIFEASLLGKGLASNMHIEGNYRLALSKDSLDLIPLYSQQFQQQYQQHATKQQQQLVTHTGAATTTTTTTSTTATNQSSNVTNHHLNHHHHHHHHHHQQPSPNQPHHNSNHHNHNQQHQRFCKRHPLLAARTIELVLRSIRRCGHTNSNFYIESGRHSQIGEGDLWMNLKKKSTAQHLHELLLATMKLASNDCQFLYKAPRSRSGSSSDNAYKNGTNNNLFSQQEVTDLAAELKRAAAKISSSPLQDDSDYLPMA